MREYPVERLVGFKGSQAMIGVILLLANSPAATVVRVPGAHVFDM